MFPTDVAGCTGPRFAEVFQRAGAARLRRDVHAGELGGPVGVRSAIELPGADRIDHGVRAIEDLELVGLLVDRQIPPGVRPSIEDLPIDRLRCAGVAVSINTDNPMVLGPVWWVNTRCAASRSVGRTMSFEHWRNSNGATIANADIRSRLNEALANW